MSEIIVKLRREIHAVQSEVLDLDNRLAKTNDTLRLNQLLAEALATQAKEKNLKIERLSELIIVESGLPPDVIKTRNKLIRADKNSKREDITVAKKRTLEAEVKDTLDVLQSVCPHTLVLNYEGYEGSYINENSDARYGVRKCVICKLTESSRSTRHDIYTILVEKEGRLIKRDIRESLRTKDWMILHKWSSQWHPLDFFVEAFRRSAGDMNVNWPVIQDEKITDKSDYFKPGY